MIEHTVLVESEIPAYFLRMFGYYARTSFRQKDSLTLIIWRLGGGAYLAMPRESEKKVVVF